MEISIANLISMCLGSFALGVCVANFIFMRFR